VESHCVLGEIRLTPSFPAPCEMTCIPLSWVAGEKACSSALSPQPFTAEGHAIGAGE
jgi:hypothetical protein